tara:strand:+ start:980 stop:1291 length:312 start_codon:yes stop_codon:yes gene_type:complete
MKVHWLVKYYIATFTAIFVVVFFIETSEPHVNWLLYPNVLESDVKNIILNKECVKLEEIHDKEYNLNYEKNFLGIDIRKDAQSVRGLNLLKYLNYYAKKMNCN